MIAQRDNHSVMTIQLPWFDHATGIFTPRNKAKT